MNTGIGKEHLKRKRLDGSEGSRQEGRTSFIVFQTSIDEEATFMTRVGSVSNKVTRGKQPVVNGGVLEAGGNGETHGVGRHGVPEPEGAAEVE